MSQLHELARVLGFRHVLWGHQKRLLDTPSPLRSVREVPTAPKWGPTAPCAPAQIGYWKPPLPQLCPNGNVEEVCCLQTWKERQKSRCSHRPPPHPLFAVRVLPAPCSLLCAPSPCVRPSANTDDTDLSQCAENPVVLFSAPLSEPPPFRADRMLYTIMLVYSFTADRAVYAVALRRPPHPAFVCCRPKQPLRLPRL